MALALARLGGPEAEAALIDLCWNGPLPARRAAVEALREVPGAPARETLEAVSARDPDPAVRRAAALALVG